jgi:hypothetical protein
MAMVTVYFDDSGTHAQSEVAVASCFISDIRRWKGFESAWGALLDREKIRDEGFHMTDFVARGKPFIGWDEERRDSLICDLISEITKPDAVLIGMTAAVIKKDYDRFVTGRLREKLSDSHYTFAVQNCLALIERWRLEMRDTQPYEYVFDMMGKGKNKINDLFDSILENKLSMHFGVELRGWSFQDRKSILPLQASDILAWESGKYIREAQPEVARRSLQAMFKGVEIRTSLFDATRLPAFAAEVTAKYEAVGWDGPLGGFLP